MYPRKTVGLITLVALAVVAAVVSARQPGRPEYDLVIRGGTVVDGTGGPRFRADVAIKGDRIADVSTTGIPAGRADAVLSAEGLIVAPGFIDQHAHIQTTIHEYPLAENFTRQGITTILASLHSGEQPWPLDRYMADLRVAPNVGFFAGHSWVRTKVLGLANRAPTTAELETMKGLVEESMRAGALGLSTGLVYVPANYAKTEEVIELAKIAARHGGIYVSHMRDEATGLLDSVAELIRISREAGLPGQVQHHKAVGVSQWGWSSKSLAMIDEARASGLDIKLDLYPYTASSTGSSVLFPQWALADGPKAFAARVADAAQRRKIEADMREIFVKERGGNDLSRVQFRVVRSDPRYNGKTLADLARDRNMPNTVDSGIQLAIELQLKGGFSAIYHSIDEKDVQAIMRHPLAMFDTDADLVEYGFGFPHPRSYGTFPRVLGRYVRELKVLTLEEAIRRMTSLSADQIGQKDRGRLAAGMFADITVFDAGTVADIATFTQPHQYPLGIRHVVVNGVPIIRNGALTGAKPGRVLKGPARPTPSSVLRREPPTLVPRADGQQWPSFRGPRASGVGDGQDPPLLWDATTSRNVVWKVALPGLGHSSPVVWDDRVFVTTAVSARQTPVFRRDVSTREGDVINIDSSGDRTSHIWRVYCLDKRTGKVLWEATAHEGAPRVDRHLRNSHATATPATNGEYVVVLFGSEGLFSYRMDGTLAWKRSLGVLDAGSIDDPDFQWGTASSPILFRNFVIVQCDVQDGSFVAAFEIATGREVWRTSRDEFSSWSTPTVHDLGTKPELVTNGTRFVRGYDPLTGKELWRLGGNSENAIPTPVVTSDLIFVTSGYRPVQPIFAIRPGATGDITPGPDASSNHSVAWSSRRGGPYIPTPIVYGEHLYVLSNNGVLTTYHTRTGERVYQRRLADRGGAYSASPVAADGRIYFASEDGEVHVVKAGAEYELLATNQVGDVTMATPAMSGGLLLLRTLHHLYAFGDTSPTTRREPR